MYYFIEIIVFLFTRKCFHFNRKCFQDIDGVAVIITRKQNSSLIIHCSSGQVVVYDGSGPGLFCIIKPAAWAATIIRVKTRWNEGDKSRGKRMSAPGQTTDFLRRLESAGN